MSPTKEELKVLVAEEQDFLCAITGNPLPMSNGKVNTALIDLDRVLPGSEGGRYVYGNVRAVLPAAHRDAHDNRGIEDPELRELRSLMDDYRTTMRLGNKMSNARLAQTRRMGEVSAELDVLFTAMEELLGEHQSSFKKEAEKQLKRIELPIAEAIHNIHGIGPIGVAELITTIQIEKAQYPSSLWSYVGYAGPSSERHKKGVKGGGNKSLRTAMYNVGMGLIKAKNEDYTESYYRYKERLENSQKTVKHGPSKKETAWADVNPGRRHLAALRYMNKMFLADLWFVWRTLEGLPTPELYVNDKLGHEAMIAPEKRGWVF